VSEGEVERVIGSLHEAFFTHLDPQVFE